MKVRQSDVEPNVPLPVPPGIICFWKKTRATIPSGWGLCDGLWYDPLDMTQGQVGQASTDANHTVQTESLLNQLIMGAGGTYAQGATGGAATVALSEAQMPTHKHDVSIPSHSNLIGTFAAAVGGLTTTDQDRGQSNYGHVVTESDKGSGGAHNNLPPYCAEFPIEKL